MKRFFIFSTILSLSAALCSCSNNNDTADLNSYVWGLATTQEQYSKPEEENVLYLEVKKGITDFIGKYNGTGLFYSDASALEKANCDAALSAYDALEATINERIKTFDNYGKYFKIDTKYFITKGGAPLRDEVCKTFELKKDKYIRFDDYKTVTEIPLTDELLKKDPASYPVTIDLEATGMDFEFMTGIRYDSVKVYASSTRVINTELTFISGGSASFGDKTLTLTFTGTSEALQRMKGNWYANAYVTMNSSIADLVGIVRVPFKVQ